MLINLWESSREQISIPYTHLGQQQVRRGLLDHQIRVRPPVRHGVWRLHLHEPHLGRDHLRDGPIRAQFRHHRCQP